MHPVFSPPFNLDQAGLSETDYLPESPTEVISGVWRIIVSNIADDISTYVCVYYFVNRSSALKKVSKTQTLLLPSANLGYFFLPKAMQIKQLEKLRVIDLSGNNLMRIPTVLFQQVSSVTSLNLSYNKLVLVPMGLSHLSQLEVAYICLFT